MTKAQDALKHAKSLEDKYVDLLQGNNNDDGDP
jgi:hypothetical protein